MFSLLLFHSDTWSDSDFEDDTEAEIVCPEVIAIEDSPVKLVVSPQYRYVIVHVANFYVEMFGFCLLFHLFYAVIHCKVWMVEAVGLSVM